jgi:hypothetical protein
MPSSPPPPLPSLISHLLGILASSTNYLLSSTYIISLVVVLFIHPSKFLIPEEDDGGLHSVRRSQVPTSDMIMYTTIRMKLLPTRCVALLWVWFAKGSHYGVPENRHMMLKWLLFIGCLQWLAFIKACVLSYNVLLFRVSLWVGSSLFFFFFFLFFGSFLGRLNKTIHISFSVVMIFGALIYMRWLQKPHLYCCLAMDASDLQ